MARIITFDDDFIGALADAIDMLDTLGQLQSAVGGLSMQHRAGKTFEAHARLENGLRRIIHAAQQEAKEPSEALLRLANTLDALKSIRTAAESVDIGNDPEAMRQAIIDLSSGWGSDWAFVARGGEAA